ILAQCGSLLAGALGAVATQAAGQVWKGAVLALQESPFFTGRFQAGEKGIQGRARGSCPDFAWRLVGRLASIERGNVANSGIYPRVPQSAWAGKSCPDLGTMCIKRLEIPPDVCRHIAGLAPVVGAVEPPDGVVLFVEQVIDVKCGCKVFVDLIAGHQIHQPVGALGEVLRTANRVLGGFPALASPAGTTTKCDGFEGTLQVVSGVEAGLVFRFERGYPVAVSS